MPLRSLLVRLWCTTFLRSVAEVHSQASQDLARANHIVGNCHLRQPESTLLGFFKALGNNPKDFSHHSPQQASSRWAIFFVWILIVATGLGCTRHPGVQPSGSSLSPRSYAHFLVLRTASNFTMQHPGITAIQSLANEEHGQDKGYSAFLPAFETAYLTGSTVVNCLLANWTTYRDKLPGN